jgi:hypothetical protein
LSERDGNGYASDLGQPKTEIFFKMGLDRQAGKTRSDLPVEAEQELGIFGI